jgi:hypothetical protein
LHELVDQGREILEIPTDLTWEEAVAKTVEALRLGADFVYQAPIQ